MEFARLEELLSCSLGGLDDAGQGEEMNLLGLFLSRNRKRRQFCHESAFRKQFDLVVCNRIVPFAALLPSASNRESSFSQWPAIVSVENMLLYLSSARLLSRDAGLVATYHRLEELTEAILKIVSFLLQTLTSPQIGAASRFVQDLSRCLAESISLLSKLADDSAVQSYLSDNDFESLSVDLLQSQELGVVQCTLHIILLLCKDDMDREKLLDLGVLQLSLLMLDNTNVPLAIAIGLLRLLGKLMVIESARAEAMVHGVIGILLPFLQSDEPTLLLAVVQVCEPLSSDYHMEIRAAGVIPHLTALLSRFSPELPCPSEMKVEIDSRPASRMSTPAAAVTEQDKRRAAMFSIQRKLLCSTCAVLSNLARYEINALQIQESNGIFFGASLLITADSLKDVTHPSKSVHNLLCYATRFLRFLFSAERNRRFFKRMFPPDIFSVFIDIGHYTYDLHVYLPLAKALSKLQSRAKYKLLSAVLGTDVNVSASKTVREYDVYEVLGSGSFGCVYRARKDGENCALKEIALKNPLVFGATDESRSQSLKLIENEVKIIEGKLRHPNVVHYMTSFVDGANLYVVMELVEGASLNDHFNAMLEKKQSFEDSRIWKIFVQLCSGLRYIHVDKKVVHRDLTPSNIMLGWFDKVIITDFGLARKGQTGNTLMQSSVGTLCYSCPEIVTSSPYSAKSDIWSLGCVLYQLCTLAPPFNTTNLLALAKRIVEAIYPPVPEERDPLLRQVVTRCLTANADKRPTIVEVCSIIGPAAMLQLDELTKNLQIMERRVDQERRLKRRHRNEAREQKISMQAMLRAMHARSRSQTSVFSLSDQVPPSPYIDGFSDGQMARPRTSPLQGSFRSRAETKPSVSHAARPLSGTYNGNGTNEVFDETAYERSRTASMRSDRDTSPSSLNDSFRSRHPRGGVSASRPASSVKPISIPTHLLKPLQDPVLELLQPLHKLTYIINQPPENSNPARYVLARFHKLLFGSNSTSSTLKDHLQRLANGDDTPVDLDFGQAAHVLRVGLDEASDTFRTGVQDAQSDADPEMRERHSLTYRQLRLVLEREMRASTST